jgi:hypothetical protein
MRVSIRIAYDGIAKHSHEAMWVILPGVKLLNPGDGMIAFIQVNNQYFVSFLNAKNSGLDSGGCKGS